MNLSKTWMMVLPLVAFFISTCGEDGNCTRLCNEVKPKLIEQLPDVSPEDVQCAEPPWTDANNCDDCLQVMEDLFDTSVTNETEICSKHFGD